LPACRTEEVYVSPKGLSLRVKDLDFERTIVIVRDGKGGRDRVVVLPKSLVPDLRDQLRRSREL
jgi:integrase